MTECKHTWPGKRTGDSCPDCWKKMKPLKDIGKPGGISWYWSREIKTMAPLLICLYDEQRDDGCTEHLIMSLEERRELARELLSKGFSAGLVHADCEKIEECEADFIEDFLKSEGI